MPRKKGSGGDRRKKVAFALNGLSVNTITISQDGDVEVEFDLPSTQTDLRWQTSVEGNRTLDVYDDDELKEACRQLFQIIRKRVTEPDEEREALDCDSCATSSCCRQYNVLLRDTDIDRLTEGLGIGREELLEKYADEAVDWCGDFLHQLACDEDDEGDEKCVFLKEDDVGRWRCSIYEIRPQICRDFDVKTCNDFVPIEEIEVAH